MKRNKPGTYKSSTYFATTPSLDCSIRDYASEHGLSYNQSINDIVNVGLHLARPLPKKIFIDDNAITNGIAAALSKAAEEDNIDLNDFIEYMRLIRSALRNTHHILKDNVLRKNYGEYEQRGLHYTVRPHFITTPKVEEMITNFSKENNLSYSKGVNYMIELGLHLLEPTPNKYLLNEQKIRASLERLTAIANHITSDDDFQNIRIDLAKMAQEFSLITEIINEGGLNI